MKLLAAGASLAGAGPLAGCMASPSERILPRVEQPPEMTPGVPLEYATSMVLDGLATGLLVHAVEGRPTKIEGNPDHPSSLGATSAIHQASILDLYDPDRAAGARQGGLPRAPEAVFRHLARRPALPGLWVVLPPQSSPLVEQLMARLLERHPGARFVFHAPLDRRTAYEGARLAFGRPLETQLRFDRADVVVSLAADFLGGTAASLRWSQDFARRRRMAAATDDPGRLHIAEPSMTPTGSLADHRLAARSSEIGLLAAALAGELERRGVALPDSIAAVRAVRLTPPRRAWVSAAAADLARSRGRGLIVAGDEQPAAVHALVHALNGALDNHGRTVWYTRPAVIEPLGATLSDMAAAARSGAVRTAVIVDANPVYTAPAELDFAALLARVPDTVSVSEHVDETWAACGWSLPLAHYLESWGDARAHDGTLSLVQPLIRPLYDGVTTADVLAMLAGDERPDTHRRIRALHGAPIGGGHEEERTWQARLRLGLVPGSAFAAESARVTWSQSMVSAVARLAHAARPGAALELCLAPSAAVRDGRFADNGWLQELPRPITKLTWDNAALVDRDTAARMGIETGDVVRLEVGGRSLEAPALIAPGQAAGAVTLELGHGRRSGGLGRGIGVDAYRLRTAAAPWFAGGLGLTRTGRRHRLAVTQGHWALAGRAIALHATAAEYRRKPDLAAAHRGPQPTVLPDLSSKQPQWGMTIDTSLCTGCSACVIACQAENNVPIVGKQGVLDHREMHWLRIDTYAVGDQLAPDTVIHQPMLCQHCDAAPCEYVCPTYATQHSPDGLNEMVYNRCIGTRFCSNNCPYKVRRFNWFDYTEGAPRTVQLQRNPDVTVRARGVMEKCTYCVQRIRRSEIGARVERRELRPGEVVTACQQACPTRAISFGLLNQERAPVVQWRRQGRAYEVLHELGTRPHTIYLAKITNPGPEPT